jgi:hypothetical protein
MSRGKPRIDAAGLWDRQASFRLLKAAEKATTMKTQMNSISSYEPAPTEVGSALSRRVHSLTELRRREGKSKERRDFQTVSMGAAITPEAATRVAICVVVCERRTKVPTFEKPLAETASTLLTAAFTKLENSAHVHRREIN